MNRVLMMLSILLAVLSAGGSLALKNYVQGRVTEAEALAARISADQEAIRVLRAEHAYLSSPGRIQRQALEHLAMMPPMPDQILDGVTEIPFRASSDAPVEGGDVLRRSDEHNRASKKGAL